MFSIAILVQLGKKLNQKQDFQIKITLTTFMVKISCPNSIPTRILKLLKKDISTQPVDIFNPSFSSGIYPTSLKTAKVIPIHKKTQNLNVLSTDQLHYYPVLTKFWKN